MLFGLATATVIQLNTVKGVYCLDADCVVPVLFSLRIDCLSSVVMAAVKALGRSIVSI